MAYFNKYYIEFEDNHPVTPAFWRVDIMDSEGAPLSEPIKLPAAGATPPLVTERLNLGDNKNKTIIGRQITISYEYTGEPGIPSSDEFFDSPERRFRVEVRKNGILDGVYFIKPDFSEYPWDHPPVTISLVAVDGLSYATGTLFNMNEGGLLKYDKISLYEALLTRGLFQIIDPTTPVNVLQSLYPDNIEPGERMLFGLFVHTDMFYDFVEGAKTVHQVADSLAFNFSSRIFMAKNELWFIRVQDLTGDTFSVDRYTDSSTVTTVSVPDFIQTVGPNFSYNALPINRSGLIRMLPAVKRADFEVSYKAINKISNFDWQIYNGSDFDDWIRLGSSAALLRPGSGDLIDPYRAGLPLTNNPEYWVYQTGGSIHGEYNPELVISPGQIVDFELKYRFTNTKQAAIVIFAATQNAPLTPDLPVYYLDSSGIWTLSAFTRLSEKRVILNRMGRKSDGSIKIKSTPIPFYDGDRTIPYPLYIFFNYPTEPSDTYDGPFIPSFQIFPIKLGIINNDSKGRHIEVENALDFSFVQDSEDFTFIDTGDDGLSNTIFTGVGLEPARNWDNDKPEVSPQDLELHMADAAIDQFQRSVKSIDIVVESNTLEFYSVLDFFQLNRRFMQLSDTYNNRTCEHSLTVAEVFQEGTAQTTKNEWDIEEEKD